MEWITTYLPSMSRAALCADWHCGDVASRWRCRHQYVGEMWEVDELHFDWKKWFHQQRKMAEVIELQKLKVSNVIYLLTQKYARMSWVLPCRVCLYLATARVSITRGEARVIIDDGWDEWQLHRACCVLRCAAPPANAASAENASFTETLTSRRVSHGINTCNLDGHKILFRKDESTNTTTVKGVLRNVCVPKKKNHTCAPTTYGASCFNHIFLNGGYL